LIKRLPLYPFLFIIYVILAPLANNLGQLDPAQALRPLLVLLLGATVGLLLLRALFKDWQYAAYVVFLILAFFFVFGHLNRLAQDIISFQNKDTAELVLLIAWGGTLVILGLKRTWSRINGRVWIPLYLNLVFALALILPCYIVLTHLLHIPHRVSTASAQTMPNSDDTRLDCSSRPDIYYIILDAYGRQDVLNGLYGVDNQPFIDYLESKGFYVASDSHSNYIQTIFSIPSSLSYSFIDPPREGSDSPEYFSNLVEYNRIMSDLKSCDYLTLAIESGFYFTENPGTDIYLSSNDVLNNFEDLLLAGSPWQVISDQLNLQPVQQSYKAHRQRVLYSFEQLRNLYKMPGPKIVFAHIISPHPPFVFDASGRPVEPVRGYSENDGDEFEGTLEEYRAGYAMQVQFVNKKLEQAIDSILAKSPTPPVIIIQGDHGPGSHLNWNSPENTCLWERTSILNAYYLPGDAKSMLYPSISPVNSFRVVLDAYFGAELPLLPDRTYFTSHRLERQSIDITADRSSRKNCTP
jgi:hypothetical protein